MGLEIKPTETISKAAIEYAGYSSEKAEFLWDLWTSMPEDEQEFFGFSGMLEQHIEYSDKDADYGQYRYRKAFNAYGLRADLTEKLLDAKYDDLLHTRSANEHASNIIKTNLNHMRYAQSISTLQRQHRSSTSIGNQPGFTILWKAVSLTAAIEMKLRAKDPEPFTFSPIVSRIDFYGRNNGFQFYLLLADAVHHFHWLKEQTPDEIVLIRLKVPDHLFEESNKPHILEYPSDEFKKAVWLSRRMRSLTSDLQEIKDATVIVSDVVRGSAKSFQRMSSSEEITEDNLVQVIDCEGSKRRMKQYCFREEFEEILKETLRPEDLTIHNAEHPEEVIEMTRQ